MVQFNFEVLEKEYRIIFKHLIHLWWIEYD